MSDYKKMISVSFTALAFSLLLLGCANTTNSITDDDSGISTCEIDGTCGCVIDQECKISGTLSYRTSTLGILFEVRSLSGNKKYCIGDNGISVPRAKKLSGQQVTLIGKFQHFIEFEQCVAIKYGKTNIPCGYCGDKVFVASAITQ